MTEYNLPVGDSILKRMAETGSALMEIAKADEQSCRRRLREQWANLEHSCNRAMADFLLSAEVLLISERENRYWLTFSVPPHAKLSIGKVSAEQWPSNLQFPISCRPEVREFISNFGRLTELQIMSGWFCSPSDLRLVRQNDPEIPWGDVKGWQGALVIYQSYCGNCVLMRADGTTAKWDHELMWPTENRGAICDLRRRFPHLILDYLDYAQMALCSNEKRESPFYD